MSNQRSLGLGLIGCGAFGRFCLEAYSALAGVRIAAVADIRAELAGPLGARWGVPAYSDAGLLIARSDVDIVQIATPPSTHHDLAIAAAAAGKHVLCEKPLATRLADADEMLAAARAAGKIMPVNFVLRYNAVTDAVKAVIDSGVLGRALWASVTNCPADTSLWPDHWFWDKAVSGGIFLEHAVHFFDLCSHWLGPGRVLCAAARGRELTCQEDRVTCVVGHEGGAMSSQYHGFDQLWMMDRTDHRLVCETGDIRVEGWIPLAMSIDAAVDEAGQQRLAELCPGAEVEIAQQYTDKQGRTISRGTRRVVSRRVRLRFCPQPDKQQVYADSLRALLADQIAFIGNPAHQRRITEENGRSAVAMAEAAAELAAAGSSQPPP